MKTKEIVLSNGKILIGIIDENGKVYYLIQAVAKSCGFKPEQAKTLKRRLLKNKLTRELLKWKEIPSKVDNQFGWVVYSEDLMYLALNIPSFSLVAIEARTNNRIYKFSQIVVDLLKNPYGLIFGLLKSSFEDVLNEGINAIKTKEDIENLSYEKIIKKYPEELKHVEKIIKEEMIKKIYIDPLKKQESYRLYAITHKEKDLIFLGFCSSNVPVIKELYKQNLGFEEAELIFLSSPLYNAMELKNKIKSNFAQSKSEKGWLEAKQEEFLEYIKNEIEPNLR